MTLPAATDVSDHCPLFNTARAWMAAGHRVALATVAETWGSAPRPVGSHLVIRDDGLFEGSVSGGCVEGAVIVDGQQCLAESKSTLSRFGVADARAWEVGLACGGHIAVLIQPVQDGFFAPGLLDEISSTTAAGQNICIDFDLLSGRAEKSYPRASDHVLRLNYMPAARLAIVGAVHITQHLAPMATALGYEVLIIDPRQMFAAAERMAGLRVTTDWPDEALDQWKPDAASAIVALTHDPKLDDPALAAALKSDAFYIAALGSRKNHAGRVVRLKAAGFSEAEIARIYGPAGLSIGARAPAEIAISILAQMTAVRRKAIS